MIRICLAVLAMILIPATARAQEREPFATSPAGPLLRTDVAGSRQTHDDAPIGVGVGALKVFPAMRLRAAGDSNVLGSAIVKRGDVFVSFEPDVTATYGDAMLSIVARANAAIARYAEFTSQNRNAFGARSDASLEIGQRTNASVGVAFARAYEPPASVGAATAGVSPARFDEIKGQARLSGEFGSARVTTTGSLSRRNYAPIKAVNGALLDQSFRDVRTEALVVEAELATHTGPTLLAETGVSWIDALHPTSCCDRTSFTALFMLGVRTEPTPVVSFEALGGYLTRDYATTSFSDYSGPIWRARLEWYATPLISVALTSSRDLVSGGLPEAAGVKLDTIELNVYYEFRRDLNLTLGLTHANEDYRGTGIAVRDDAIDFKLDHLFAPRRTGGGYIRWHDRESNSLRLDTAGAAVEGGVWFRLAI